MPASRRTLALEQLIRARQAALAAQVTRLVRDQWRGVRPESLIPDLRLAIAISAQLVELGQARAQDMAAAFVRQLYLLETGGTLPARRGREIAGTTWDGRPVAEVMAVAAPRVFLSLRQGQPLERAIAVGSMSAQRAATTEVLDAGRRTIGDVGSSSSKLAGWTWVVSSGGGCGACLGMATNATRSWDEPMESHPWCTCLRSPVVAGVPDRAPRPTGEDIFRNMSPSEQAGTFHAAGEDKAELVRSGAIDLSDLVKRVDSEEWRGIVAERPLADLPTQEV